MNSFFREDRPPIINYTNRAPDPAAGSLEGGVGRILSSSLTPNDVWVGIGKVRSNPKIDITPHSGFVFKLFTFDAPAETRDGHYKEISLGFFWPFFHSLKPEIDRVLEHLQSKEVDRPVSDIFEESYEAYEQFLSHANDAFNLTEGGGKVGIIHDFTSLGVKHNNASANAFFLHVPFPDPEWVQNLMIGDKPFLETSACKKFFSSLTSYDVVGFQTKKDCDRFLAVLKKLDPEMRQDFSTGLYQAFGNVFKAASFTIGISPSEASNQARSAVYDSQVQSIVERVKGKKVVLSVARNDYTKGTAELADTIEEYFDRYPEQLGKTVFVVSRAPSRQGLIGQEEYQHQMISRYAELSNKIGDSVVYVPKGINNGQLMRFMRDEVDVLVDLPTSEEGHGLTGREFVDVNIMGSCKAIVMAEGVGSSEVLGCNGNGAFIVKNSFATSEILEAINNCLHGDPANIMKRFDNMRTASAQNSGGHFLTSLVNEARLVASQKRLIPDLSIGMDTTYNIV